jgi:hypothetical protein
VYNFYYLLTWMPFLTIRSKFLKTGEVKKPVVKEELSQNFVREFLFRPSDIHQDGVSIKAVLRMDENKEGWMGIPHGGIGMGALMELIMTLPDYPTEENSLYPFTAEFRMGGSSVKVGDVLDITVSPTEGGAEGVMINGDETFPYISADVSYGKDEPQRRHLFDSYLPDSFSSVEKHLIELPYYKNCYVCGVERIYPGLKRRFYLVPDKNMGKNLVVTTAGFASDDGGTFGRFQQNGWIHPIAPLAVLDETMGWAGFLSSTSGAVTVFISYTFYRSIKTGEKIVFFGRSERVRGRPRARDMFWASGGAAIVDDRGKLEMVIAAQGQWMGVPELTEQMHRELIPKGMIDEALVIAGQSGGSVLSPTP